MALLTFDINILSYHILNVLKPLYEKNSGNATFLITLLLWLNITSLRLLAHHLRRSENTGKQNQRMNWRGINYNALLTRVSQKLQNLSSTKFQFQYPWYRSRALLLMLAGAITLWNLVYLIYKTPQRPSGTHKKRSTLTESYKLFVNRNQLTQKYPKYITSGIFKSQEEISVILNSWQEDEGLKVYFYEDIKQDIGRDIGGGAYGTVVSLQGTFKDHCAKIYGQATFNHFKREVSTLLKLQGVEGIPNIVGVFRDPLGIIIRRHQYTLYRWKTRCLPSDLELVDVAIQLCNIVKSLHERGICHNDIKASNVMVDEKAESRQETFGSRESPEHSEHLVKRINKIKNSSKD
ncbi:hypothetical protein SK128_003461 [Halocaridina rubra]|uniref:Protein kinase domain-containing protein n=1 Tax=Halocaridina rubra TaxID=373956 RepID=A0AAN8X474_HALRR